MPHTTYQMLMTKSKAFTLVEIMIVVAVIALLAAIAIPNAQNIQLKAELAKQQAWANTTARAIDQYQIQNGSYPATIASLASATPPYLSSKDANLCNTGNPASTGYYACSLNGTATDVMYSISYYRNDDTNTNSQVTFSVQQQGPTYTIGSNPCPQGGSAPNGKGMKFAYGTIKGQVVYNSDCQ